MAGFIRQHVNATIKKSRLTQLYAKRESVTRKKYGSTQIDLLRPPRKSLKIRASAKTPTMEGVRRKESYGEDPDDQIDQSRGRPAAEGHDRLGVKIELCIEAMVQIAYNCQDYLVRSYYLFAEIQLSEMNLLK